MIPRRVLTIFARIVNFFWRWFRWGVVLGVILLAGVIITAHLRLNQEVRTQIERQLADLCEPLTVSVRSAEVVAGEGIRVHDLVIRDDRPTASRGELLRCDTVMLSCRTDWQTLLCEKPCIKRVVLKRPTLRIVRNPEGDWNLTSLLNQRRADPPTMTELPTIELDGGTIVMFDPSLGPDRRFTLREVHVTLGAPPDPSAPTSGSQPPPRPHIENITAAQTPSPWHANKLCAVTPGGSAAATPGSANAIFNQISPNGGSDDVSIPAEGSLVPEEAMAASSPTLQELRGSFLGDFLGRVSFQGVVRSDGSGGRISGSIERLELLPEARDSLPLPLSHELAALNYVRGEASLEFQVQYTPDDPKPLRFEIAGALRRGHIDDLQLALSEQQKTTDPSSHGHTAPEKPQAPLPVTDLKADFRLTDTGFELTNISARSGPATLSGSFVRHGYHPGDPARLTASIGHLQFDKRLFDLLPASLQDEWKRFDPTGRISGEIIATSDGTRWDSQLSARLDDLSFCFCDFPYRFERGTAAVTLRERRLELNVVAHAGSCPVTMEGDMILGPGAALEPANAGVSMTAGSEDAEKPKDQWIGYFTARGRGMAVDDQLRAAMPEASRDALESLGAEGRFDFQWTVWKKMPDQHPEEYMVLDANDCTVRFEHFAYPITGIFGRIEKRNKYWTFRDLRGVNDSAKITCSGTFTPTTTGDGVLSIELGATDLALDDELRVAMPLGMRQMWNTLAPQGEVDATVSVMCEFGNKQPPKITARIVPDEQVSAIQPKPFPYRMERLGGVILYRDGHVTINSLSATHGNVRLSAMATADVSPDGAWQLRLDNLGRPIDIRPRPLLGHAREDS